MTALRKGDIAILHGLMNYPQFNGMLCIVGDGAYQGFFYIDIPGFERKWDYTHQRYLRRVEPPRDESTARQAMLDCIERARLEQGATV